MVSPRILLIDDELPIRQFMQDFFEDREYTVDVAGDGLEGVELFQKNAYDLVMCDMLMPKLIGLEVLRQIRKEKPSQKFIMITGVKEESMVAKAQVLGCSFYLNKPFSLSDLEERVRQCFA